jgi:hypothetical protein
MVAGKRDVGDGVGIDATYQYITERPALEDQAEDIVDATGQTTLDDWGESA